MSDHLPWKYHVAAREAGLGLLEFNRLNPTEQNEWIRFALHGPSRFRDTLNIAHIRSLFVDFLTQSKTLHEVDEEWLDGLLEHPDDAWERRLQSAKEARKKQRIAAAADLREREQQTK